MSSGLQKAFDKYSKFGKTQAQLADHNCIRIGSAGIQKMMKDCSLIDTKYTSQLLDNDIARVLGKLTINSNESSSIHYPKGTKTFEIKGFKALIDRIAESKSVNYDEILAKINANQGPRLNHVTEIANKDITDRMTNTTQYTGTHKERFDEDGHGKGKEGRTDEIISTGYVQGFKINEQFVSTKK
ncbi:unnamed protein product [Adineta steineri]|uniref:Uncharacterized protein n=1 Tax=Adineta steineri TaxID=433720 RepID=A0A814R9N6_9BILA|nr:unnamed protein product [Adineta steineri]CAF1167955.1 unnamed protein product [Adineta steineri]CAF1560891.1 unnamed protein product [Adineta steineri]CAF1664732.1 unnamed protein product [Adineta steineri]CAF3524725.1 unnamed protein product [Adineta steineri]